MTPSVLIGARLGGTKDQLVLTSAHIQSGGIQGKFGCWVKHPGVLLYMFTGLWPGEVKMTGIIWDKKWASRSGHRRNSGLKEVTMTTARASRSW